MSGGAAACNAKFKNSYAVEADTHIRETYRELLRAGKI